MLRSVLSHNNLHYIQRNRLWQETVIKRLTSTTSTTESATITTLTKNINQQSIKRPFYSSPAIHLPTMTTTNNSLHNRTITTTTTNDNSPPPLPPTNTISLYTKTNLIFPRTILTFTTLHTTYWLWYVLDFLPFLQSSSSSAAASLGILDQTIDPIVGYVGLGLSGVMMAGSGYYATRLVGSVEVKEDDGVVRVKRVTLPLARVERGEGMVVRRWELLDKGINPPLVGRHVAVRVNDESHWLFFIQEGEMCREDLLRRVVVSGKKILPSMIVAAKGDNDKGGSADKSHDDDDDDEELTTTIHSSNRQRQQPSNKRKDRQMQRLLRRRRGAQL